MSARPRTPLIAATLVLLATSAACAGELYREDIDPEGVDTPASYRHLRNPFTNSLEAAAVGQTLYDAHCADCHGDQGRGDGPRASQMTPRPTDFVPLTVPSDGHLYWRIREGGEEQGTDMPVFRDQLEDEQIWALVTYVRVFYEEEPLYR